MIYQVALGGEEYRVEFSQAPGSSSLAIKLNGEPIDIDVVRLDGSSFSVLYQGASLVLRIHRRRDQALVISAGARQVEARVYDSRHLRRGRSGVADEGRVAVVSPMFGRVIRVLVQPGEPVQSGQGIAVIEAMKMQNELRSPKDGRLVALHVGEGDSVAGGDIVAEVE